MSNSYNVNDTALNASFLISLQIAKTLKPFTTEGEFDHNLLTSCMQDDFGREGYKENGTNSPLK
jgi:hypothetical protein